MGQYALNLQLDEREHIENIYKKNKLNYNFSVCS